MRRRPSAATAIACAALFFSLGGAGIAAAGYRITSIRQIAPRVRRQLRRERLRYEVVRSPAVPLDSESPGHEFLSETVSCGGAGRAVTGGYEEDNVEVTVDEMLGGATRAGWQVFGRLEAGSAAGSLRTWVLCVR